MQSELSLARHCYWRLELGTARLRLCLCPRRPERIATNVVRLPNFVAVHESAFGTTRKNSERTN
jgi:hypothetical protein